ncbi:MAG: mevalonate kinase [Bacteriovoracaceae bacterium]|jgi:mevalonate kinase|nr:mevalonate kinase [Bacteriovoracaceae bacterium]
MRKSSKMFYSKVLLFGEYSVIKHSMALSIPYTLFEGKLEFRRDNRGNIDLELKSFCNYLKIQKEKERLGFSIDLNSFSFDVGQGLYFDSTIPQGFGVGSSGAVCAAIYDAYAQILPTKTNNEFKNDFSLMEGHFHGSSSGIDPLISYLNEPILNRNNGEVSEVKLPHFSPGNGGIFLLNTGRARRTEPLVNLFLEKCKSKDFSKKIESELLKINDNCITSLLEGDIETLYRNYESLSFFQFDEFTPMIPNLYRDLWRDGLLYKKYFLKLCGAGGGGFLLGMTKNFDEAEELLKNYEIRPLIRF